MNESTASYRTSPQAPVAAPRKRSFAGTTSALALTAATILALVGCGGGNGAARTLIQNKGSDTLVNVAQAWAEEYSRIVPNVAVAVTGGGSGTGIAALIGGSVDVANASREMKQEEITMARNNGVEPNRTIVGYDAVAVLIHRDNPINSLTLAQLAGIYGDDGTVENWSQLGVTVPGCSGGEIVRVSRQNSSGTYVYFRETVLGGRDYKLGTLDMAGSAEVVDLVETTPCAIGYSGLAYATEHVRMPCLMTGDSACIAPSTTSAVDGTYPIARPLFMYTSGQPEGAVKDYLDWILSDEGQCIIQAKGYAPVRPLDCA